MQLEAAGGIVLLCATVVALVWANSRWQDGYTRLWETELTVSWGRGGISEDLEHWVNDLLMTFFFLLAGLEIKRELVTGELRDRRAAVVPALAAVGGMLLPAAIYVAFNAGTDTARGWGIPMATDIAFAMGVAALLGSRVPGPLKVFLLTLAIVDDIGAIAIIAIVYSDHIELRWLVGAAAITVFMVLLRRVRVVYTPVYVVAGALLWWSVFQSGVHATIAGVVVGLITPARPLLGQPDTARLVDSLENRTDLTADDVVEVSLQLRESVSVAERLERVLHPWVTFVIVPLFALANAGVPLSRDSLRAEPRLLWGIVVGLVVGKTIGITAGTWVAVRSGLGRLPTGVHWRHLVGVAALGGIGFTVALFITDLAFTDQTLVDQAKVAVLIGSAAAALAGAAILSLARRHDRPEAPNQPHTPPASDTKSTRSHDVTRPAEHDA
jgi:NhaA family Na+:H+ antiporter